MSDKKKEEVVVLNASGKSTIYVWLIDEKMYFVGTYEELNDGIRDDFDSIEKLGKAYFQDKNFHDKKSLKWKITTKTAETFKKEQKEFKDRILTKYDGYTVIRTNIIECPKCKRPSTFRVHKLKDNPDGSIENASIVGTQDVDTCDCLKEFTQLSTEYPDCLPDSFVVAKKDDIEILVHRGYICPECLKPYIMVNIEDKNIVTQVKKFKVPSCTCK